MKSLFDNVSEACSKITTQTYSTSFTFGIYFLAPELRQPIYSIYGFVRLADEIVDSFHDYDKKELLATFRNDTAKALKDRISLNPILNAFQKVVHQYNIRQEWIDAFLDSMEMDLHRISYNDEKYKLYIMGSAEVVGLMCLHVFVEGNDQLFDKLKPYAMKLGAAFQKVNFLRDLKADNENLGRTYFPEVDLNNFSSEDKFRIEKDIEQDFSEALKGIRKLPVSSRQGVYLVYFYYSVLFNKIKNVAPQRILKERIRISNFHKMILMCQSSFRHHLNLF